MNRKERNKRRWIVKPRFYVSCLLLIVGITTSIIFNLANGVENVETFEDVAMPTIVESTTNILNTTVPEPIEEFQPRYGFTDEDVYLLAQLLCGDGTVDGDGEYDIDFKKEINYYEVGKVLSVVMNRVRSEDFPNTVMDVVLQKGQFSVMPRNSNKKPSDMALQTIKEWCTAYDNYIKFVQVVPTSHLFFTGNGRINITRAEP